MSAGTVACAVCGGPAAHVTTFEPAADGEWHCETCTIRFGSEKNGEAYAALATLGFAIEQARHAGLQDADIVAAFHEIVTAPHSEGHYPVGGERALGPDRTSDRPWLRVYRGDGHGHRNGV